MKDELLTQFAFADADQARALNRQVASLARRHVFTSNEQQAEWALTVPRGPDLAPLQGGS